MLFKSITILAFYHYSGLEKPTNDVNDSIRAQMDGQFLFQKMVALFIINLEMN